MSLRVAVVHWTDGMVGGQETYVESALAALDDAGLDLIFFHETTATGGHCLLRLPPGCLTISAAADQTSALAALAAWRPDVVFVNGLLSPQLEARVLRVAPAVFFAHAYYGTCISGTKSFARPGPTRPCTRCLGPGCLALYFPRGCGGRNPMTMWREYQLQARRLALLRCYWAIITASEHMRCEYLRHGFAEKAVHVIPYPVPPPPGLPPPERPAGKPLDHLLFLGRMDGTKGGHLLVDSLPEVRSFLKRPLRVTFAGDGPARAHWVAAAARVTAAQPEIQVAFPGWLEAEGRREAFDRADLLVVPSVWPEPFGLVGPEAGHRGLPAAAFAVGGIPDWLTDGVNGRLARADPPTPAKLAGAIAACLADSAEYERLRAGAGQQAARFTTKAHIAALEMVLRSAARSGQVSVPTCE